ncbi:MAG TPA: phosphodiester glycosidase family protein [Kofleriaceae bacterium]|nr:phosphodiester glycosidase family protein [Kofleriaceae bacterium]
MSTRSRPLLMVAILVPLVLATGSAHAADTWSDPFPGVRRLDRTTSNQNIEALVIDLCAPGVGVRATAYDQRGRTVPSFAQLVGAQAAVNGDFYGSGYTPDGVAMSGGARWPGSADHGYVSPLAFGPRRVELIPHEVVADPEAWMTEIVSGHPTILQGGVTRNNNGDSLCSNRHPRTAVGLSADKRTLILAVVDGRATTRIGMTCDELAGLLRELGASDGMNLDGGGSSTMYLQGPGVVNHPSDGSPRVVANHLAVFASGSGDAPFCPNRTPRGYLDAASCDGAIGWAQDEDAPEAPIDVHLYFGGPAGSPEAVGIATRAATHRDDLCTAIGSCRHGFSLAPPAALRDGAPREVWAYAIDSEGGANAVLPGSPMTIQCDPLAPPADGVRRHVASPEVLAAWGFGFHDVTTLADPVIDRFADGAALPEAPALVRATGQNAVYLIDGDSLRHVPSPAAMDAWHLRWDAITEIGADELAAFTIGDPLPDAPYLARGSGAAVYLIDASAPGLAPPDPTDPADPTASGGCSSTDDRSAAVLLILLVLGIFRWVRTRDPRF